MSERPPLPRSPLPLSVSTSGFGVSGFKSGVSGLDSTLSVASVVVVVFASASGFCSGSGSFSPSPTSNIGSNPANSARAFATVLPASTIKESNCLPGFVKSPTAATANSFTPRTENVPRRAARPNLIPAYIVPIIARFLRTLFLISFNLSLFPSLNAFRV